MLGDEWRIGPNNGPFAYWTNPDHLYEPNEMLICALQYACPEEQIGFRYENAILITKTGCETMSNYLLGVEEIE
jgi:Xaa-Pro aminopeptidase